jgi:hypothetical protein
VRISGFDHVTIVEQPASYAIEAVNFFLNRDDSGCSALWDVGDDHANTGHIPASHAVHRSLGHSCSQENVTLHT